MLRPIQAVLGLGKTGLSLVAWLTAQGYPVRVLDTRTNPPGLAELRLRYPQVGFSGGPLSAEALLDCGRVLISPGLTRQQPAVQAAVAAGIPVVGDVELFAQAVNAPVIAITGSNGKSTVTTLVAEMLAGAGYRVVVGGNLGTPVLELLSPDAQFYVLELSSFQLESTESLAPVAATILNVTEDHMDRYDDMAAYTQAKQRVYQQCQTAVINRADPLTATDLVTHQVSFGLQAPAAGQFGLLTVDNELWLAKGSELLLPASRLRVKGWHNLANALAALALVDAAGVDVRACFAALAAYAGLEHRCQWVGCVAGADWYNDSKATNVGATQAALFGLGSGRSQDSRLVLLAGGDGKGADFSALTADLAAYVDYLLVFGQDALAIKAVCPATVPVLVVATMAEAISQAARWVQPGDLVLLSPACASLDQFRNFEHRGQCFAEQVRALA